MIGTKLSGPTILYMGWFAPRGLATIVFAALVVQEADLPGAHVATITTAAAITVGLSVLLHGLIAYPGPQRYASWVASHGDSKPLPEEPRIHRHRLRPRLRRTRAKKAQST